MVEEVIFTGGGSGGHVVPALTLIKKIKEKVPYAGITYIGSKEGIERELVTAEGIPYRIVTTGKLRRYLSFQNLLDLFKVAWGIVQSFFYFLGKSPKKTMVFSTGGFVTVPVVIGARLTGHRVFIHEQTSRVGLANKIASRFASKIFISFEDSHQFFPGSKTVLSGYPLRDECFEERVSSTILAGRDLATVAKPILFVTGGGNGALLLNKAVWQVLPSLKKKYMVIHQVGKSFFKEALPYQDEDYLPVDFVDNMIDVFKMSTVVVSRAGAGTVCELISLGKPSVFVPLKIAQKNEQYHNAMEANRLLGSWVLEEDEFSSKDLDRIVDEFYGKIKAGELKQIRQESVNASSIITEEILKGMSAHE